MNVIVPGHQYALDNLKDSGSQKLIFKNDGIEVPLMEHSIDALPAHSILQNIGCL